MNGRTSRFYRMGTEETDGWTEHTHQPAPTDRMRWIDQMTDSHTTQQLLTDRMHPTADRQRQNWADCSNHTQTLHRLHTLAERETQTGMDRLIGCSHNTEIPHTAPNSRKNPSYCTHHRKVTETEKGIDQLTDTLDSNAIQNPSCFNPQQREPLILLPPAEHHTDRQGCTN